MAAVPLLPSLVAVIVAEPAATAVSNPLLLTVATLVLLLDQVTTRPVRALPAESAVADWVSLVATIVVVPADTPVATPLELTVAVPGLLLTQVIRRPVSGLPAESSGEAVNCCTVPTTMPAVGGDRVSEATETVLTVTVAESAAEPGLACTLTLYCPGAAGAW